MRSELKHIERIENYLAGNLSDSDKLELENELMTNPDLQEALEFQEYLQFAANRKGLRDDIEKVSQMYPVRESFFKTKFFKWGLNFLIGIIILSGLWIFLTPQSSSNQPEKLHFVGEAESVSSSSQKDSNIQITSVKRVRNVRRSVYGELKSADLTEMVIQGAEIRKASPIHQLERKEELNLLDWNELNFIPASFYTGVNNLHSKFENSQYKLSESLYFTFDYDMNDGEELEILGVANSKNALSSAAQSKYVKIYVLNMSDEPLSNVKVRNLNSKNFVRTVKNGEFLMYTLTDRQEKAVFELEDGQGRVIYYEMDKLNKRKSKVINVDFERQGRTRFECFINPAKISSLKSEEYTGTFIQTKDFEKRIQFLHKQKNGEKLLDVYTSNSHLSLKEADQIVQSEMRKEEIKNFENYLLNYAEYTSYIEHPVKIKDGRFRLNIFRQESISESYRNYLLLRSITNCL